jgi:hypothetical protein
MDNEGEGLKINPPIVTARIYDKPLAKVEPIIPANGYKDVPIIERNGWQKKFLGIPAWGWVVIGLCLVFGGALLGIALAVH